MAAFSCERAEELYVYHEDIVAGPAILQLECGHFELLVKCKRVAKPPKFSSGAVCRGSSRVGSFYLSKEKRIFSYASLFAAKPYL